MTAKNIVSIVLRLWGALWVLSTVINMSAAIVFVVQAADSQSRSAMVSNGVVGLVWLVLGCVLFFKNERIAAALFPGTEGELAISATPEELLAVGFALLAIYFGIRAVSTLAGLIYQWARAPIDGQSGFGELAQLHPDALIKTATQLLVCLFLFFDSKGLSAFWSRLRGRNQPASGDPGDV